MKKYNVLIEKIEWIDKEALEAEVMFFIKDKAFLAFSSPCYFVVNQKVDVCLSFIQDDIPILIFFEENKTEQKNIIQSKTTPTRYYCYGQIKSIHPVVIDCGIISFEYEDFINDPKVIGAFVYFVIARLDIERV